MASAAPRSRFFSTAAAAVESLKTSQGMPLLCFTFIELHFLVFAKPSQHTCWWYRLGSVMLPNVTTASEVR